MGDDRGTWVTRLAETVNVTNKPTNKQTNKKKNNPKTNQQTCRVVGRYNDRREPAEKNKQTKERDHFHRIPSFRFSKTRDVNTVFVVVVIVSAEYRVFDSAYHSRRSLLIDSSIII